MNEINYCPVCGYQCISYRKTPKDWYCPKCKAISKYSNKKPYLKLNIKVFERLIDEPPLNTTNESGRKSISKKMVVFIHERDNNICQVCDSHDIPNLKIHHINPRGESTQDNLILICKDCHNFIHELLRRKGYSYYNPSRDFYLG